MIKVDGRKQVPLISCKVRSANQMFSFDKIASIFSETKLAETNTVVSDLDGKKCASQVEETQKTSGTEMKKVSSNESPSSSGIYNTFILFNSFFLSLMLVTVKF